jgi:hypothetical protein
VIRAHTMACTHGHVNALISHLRLFDTPYTPLKFRSDVFSHLALAIESSHFTFFPFAYLSHPPVPSSPIPLPSPPNRIPRGKTAYP